MKNKLKYNLTKVKSCETQTPAGMLSTLMFEDGKRIDVYSGNFIQLLAWLEISEEDGDDVSKLLNEIYELHDYFIGCRGYEIPPETKDEALLRAQHKMLEIASWIERIYY